MTGSITDQALASPPPNPVPPNAASGWSTPAGDKRGEGRPDHVPPADRNALLGDGYEKSADRAWDTSSDATGFHLLVADEKSGYTWRTAASLSEPGFDTDMWVGNACLADPEHAVVTYAPRTFTNEPQLMARGAFAATVDLATGEVTKLPHTASLAYFSPGCGTDGTAVLSQFSDETTSEKNETRLIPVDARTGAAGEPVTLAGQVTSAVPVADGWVAADGDRLVRVGRDGEQSAIAGTHGTPFQLTVDGEGGVTFLDRAPATGEEPAKGYVKRITGGQIRTNQEATTLAAGELTGLDLTRTATGTVFVTGQAESTGALPAAVSNPGGIDKDARVSTHGRAAVRAVWADGTDPRGKSPDELRQRPARIDLTHLVTGRKTAFEVVPEEESEPQAGVRPLSNVSDPASVRTCAVERGNPQLQAMQPTPRQVEWAVDQAITGALDQGASRPANWNNTGLPAYRPQALAGGLTTIRSPFSNRRIPAQIMLGITAQESNMWQATRYAAPGMTANPLIGNYFGIRYDPGGDTQDQWDIDWAAADCGYGVTQVTDGMRLAGKEKPGETAKSPLAQKAIAVDYAANIAFGVNILAEKWNQLYAAGMQVNDGDPLNIENWTMALWAYNSGFHPSSDAAANAGKWGLGWTNNPAMPWYKANRAPFLAKRTLCHTPGCTYLYEDDYSHAASPQYWPYQEKVIGWAARPISAMEAPGQYVAGYRPAWWTTEEGRWAAKPPVDLFCTTANECDPDLIEGAEPGNDATSPCLRRHDFRCWWTQDVEWKDCGDNECGYELLRFNPGYAPQPNGTPHTPRCGAILPAAAVIVDNVADGQRIASAPERACPSGTASSGGSFAFDFSGTEDSARMEVHQLSGGYQNHVWFSHTVKSSDSPTAVTGTWTAPESVRGWHRVLVHMPSISARSQQAKYTVQGTDSSSPSRVAPQRLMTNTWRSLGTFNFTSRAKVSLSNLTAEKAENLPIAWDAVAFQPIADNPYHVVGMGDSYASGEGASAGGGLDYLPETDYVEEWEGGDLRNSCHRSKDAWIRKARLPGDVDNIGRLSDIYSDVELSFVACSSARTYHVRSGGKWQSSSLPQNDLGYLDNHTDLVTLSIGGNDARFSAVFDNCVAQIGQGMCMSSTLPVVDPLTGDEKAGQTEELETHLPKWIDNEVRTNVVSVLTEIKQKAPNARLILMGYPKLIGPEDCLAASVGFTLQQAERAWLDETLAPKLSSMLAAAAGQVGADYVDPDGEFEGHRICDDDHAIWGVVFTDKAKADSGTGKPAMKSFHPDTDGAALFARALERELS
ncbi:GDSL-type esterase/lipase family protein [Actinosynnema sp. NPDC050801]|uniref:GDSL-type esterase/lipase family protein n=1 Tax=unclassified Actinosynnema TaxID=2637065 RepID=UPI003403F441